MTPVERTAYLAAALRAAETRRPVPRLRDPYAALFATDDPGVRRLAATGGDEVVARTVLVDELLGTVLSGQSGPLVLNLGAGCCARPYRLDLSGCAAVVELDGPEVLARKEAVLGEHRPSCPVERIPLDLGDADALATFLAARDVRNSPVVVVSEGLLPYLDPAPLARVLAGGLGEAVWLTDLVSTASARAMARLAQLSTVDVAVSGLETLEPFEAAGWHCTDYRILPVSRTPSGGGSGRMVVDGVAVFVHHPQHR